MPVTNVPKPPPSSEITPEAAYADRRRFLKNSLLFAATAAGVGGGLVWLTGGARGRGQGPRAAPSAGGPGELGALRPSPYSTDEPMSTYAQATTYNNFYELGLDKGDPSRPSQRQHTFAWDNVAFDGPFVYRDFSYDALDNTLAGASGSLNLGKYSVANQTTTWNVLNMPANPQASAARVLFNFNGEAHPDPTVLNVIVNGHSHTVPWPYPDQVQFSWRTFAVTVPLTDLVAGTNVVQLGADAGEIFSNVNIVLVDVPGGVPVLPGSNNTYP